MAHHGNTRPIVLLPTPNSQNNAQAHPNLTHNLQQNTRQPFQNFTPNHQQNTGQSFQNFTPNLQQNTGQPFKNFTPNLQPNTGQLFQNFTPNRQQNTGQPFQNFTPNLQQNTGKSSFTPNFTPNTNFINHPNTVNPNPGFVQTVNPNPGFVQPPPYNFGQHGVQNINTGNQQFNPQQMHQQVRPSGNQFNVQAARPNINHNVNNSRQQPVGFNADQFAFGSNAANHGQQFAQSPQFTRFTACDRPQTRHVSPPQTPLAQSTIRLSGQTNQSSGLLRPPSQHGVNNNNNNVNRNVGIGNQCHVDHSNVSKGAGHAKEKRPTAFHHKPQVGIQTKNPLISFNQQKTSSVGQGYKRRSLLSTPLVNKLVKNVTKTKYGRVTRRDIPMKQSYGAHSKGRKISHGYIQGVQNNVAKMTLKSELKINQRSDTSKQKPFEIREVQKVKEQENVTEKGHFEGQQGLDTSSSSIEIVPKLSQLQISEVNKERNVSYSSVNPKVSRDMTNLIQVKLDHGSENINSKLHTTQPEVKPTLDSKDEMKHHMEVKSSYGSKNSDVKVNKSNTDLSSDTQLRSSKVKVNKSNTDLSSDTQLGSSKVKVNKSNTDLSSDTQLGSSKVKVNKSKTDLSSDTQLRSSKVKLETTKDDFMPNDKSLKSPGVMTIGSEAKKNYVTKKCTIEKTNTKIERKTENLLSKTKKMNNNEKSIQSGSNSQLDMTGRIPTATCVEKNKSNDKKSTAVSNVAQSNLSGQTYQIAKSIKALIKQLDKQNKDVKNKKLPCEENICSGESHVSKGLSDKKDRVKKGGKYFLSKAKGENTKARTAKRRDDETTAFGGSENSNKGDNIEIGHIENNFTTKSVVKSAESEQVDVPACKATRTKDSIKLQNSSEIKMYSRSEKSETSVKEAWVDKRSHDFVEMSSDSGNEKQSDTEYKRIEEKMDSKISWKKTQQSSFKKEVENKHLKGDVSIDKLKSHESGDVSSHMIDVSSHQIDNNNTERVPIEEKSQSESRKNNIASIKVVNEIEVSGVIVGQESSSLDHVTDIEVSVDTDTDMYPRFNNCGNPSQRGRLNQNYYNARQDERYRQSYENQRDFQYPRESYDRRDIPFNQHPNTNRNHYENYQKNYQGDDRRCYDDYHEQDSFTRPPIHNRRYNEGEVFSSDHRQYENTNFNRGRRRNQSQGNVGLPQHERVQRSFSSEAAGNRQDFKKSDSYSNSENSKGQETSRNEPNENKQHGDGKGDQSCQSTDKNYVNNQNLSPRPVVNKNAVPCVFSPGSNIYQSDQYFSAADKLQDGEGKSKTTPNKNLKRHMSDIMGNHSESKGVQKGKSPVRRQESAPVGASKEKTPTKMDKMDFSSIKKALNEVKSVDDTCMKGKEEINQNTSESQTNNSPIQNKTIDNKMESSSIERKRSVDIVKEKISSVQEVIPSSPLQRKNSKEKVYGGKAQSSPRSRNSSGDSQGMLSPKTDAKQRSAFQVVLQREDRSSETSKMSPKDNPSSPLDRKRSSSGDLKQFGIQSPDMKVIDSTYNAISEEEGSLSGSPDKSGISLKSALSYPEWKRLKAQKDLELQKEREKNRKCIELANTPEEYRKLLKLQEKKAREKERSRKISETETEKKYVENNEKAVNSDEEIESSQLPTLHNSQNSFQAIQDNLGSDEDIDLEESDDDDLEAPSFLFSLEEASNRPIPRTPTKITHLDSPGPCSPAPVADLTDITTKTLLSSKFSLDQLVSEKVDKSEDQREYEEMHAKLEEGLKKGGFVKDTLETVEPQEDEILPEHEKHLQEFKILDSVISEVHPGDVIFQPLLHQSRFTGSLSLQTCGYTPGTSFIDKYLSTLQPKDYSLLLTSNILQNTLESVACQEAVLRWLFLLMSVHSNQLVTQGCHKTLLEHLNRQIHFKQLPQTWIPAIPDVLSVFCNYGCEVSRLLPDNIADSTEEYSTHIVHEEQNGMIPRGGNSICRNLHLVLNIIGQCLHSRPRCSSKQLTDLLIILCHVAMDKSHNSEVLPHEFQVCLKGILKSYSSNYWESHCNELCHTLFKITGHHHNRQYLAQLLPEDKRGAYLQRRLAYLYLQDMFDVGRDTDIKDYKIKCLHVYLTKLQKLVPTDVYKLSSAISYLDIAVGNSAIKVAEKDDLQYLCDQLKKISGDVKDSVQMLDRSWVKDMMVRVCSKWTLYLLTVGSKQKSMFAYTKKKTPAVFEIKTVEASQGDISSQSEGEEEESKEVPKDIIVDNRTPIITDIQCITDENSNQSQSKTFTLDNENCENEIDKEVEKTVIIKIEKPDIIPISDSPMEVDLTEDDLPDLLDHS